MLTALALALSPVAASPVVPAQDDPRGTRRAPKIEMPHALPDEPLVYERTWSRHRVDLDQVMADSEHAGTLTLTVRDVDDKGNRTVEWSSGAARWVRDVNEGELVDRAADKGVAELRTDVTYDLLVTPKYRTLLLEDPEAARGVAEAAVARAEAEIEAGQYFYAIKERAKAIVKSAFATPELIEYTLLEEPTVLFQPLGRTYRMGEDRRWEDFFINPVGVAPLPALSVLFPVRHDEEAGTLEVHWTRELVPEDADPILVEDLTNWRRRLKVNDELPSIRAIFDLREEVRYLLDLETGLPLFAEKRAFVRIGEDERLESVRFVAAGFDPPAALIGEWGRSARSAETADGSAGGTATGG